MWLLLAFHSVRAGMYQYLLNQTSYHLHLRRRCRSPLFTSDLQVTHDTDPAPRLARPHFPTLGFVASGQKLALCRACKPSYKNAWTEWRFHAAKIAWLCMRADLGPTRTASWHASEFDVVRARAALAGRVYDRAYLELACRGWVAR
jgi:hypothetical protein